MKHKTLNLEEKKLQLKKTTIEIFNMAPKHLRIIVGRGHKETDDTYDTYETHSPTR